MERLWLLVELPLQATGGRRREIKPRTRNGDGRVGLSKALARRRDGGGGARVKRPLTLHVCSFHSGGVGGIDQSPRLFPPEEVRSLKPPPPAPKGLPLLICSELSRRGVKASARRPITGRGA